MEKDASGSWKCARLPATDALFSFFYFSFSFLHVSVCDVFVCSVYVAYEHVLEYTNVHSCTHLYTCVQMSEVSGQCLFLVTVYMYILRQGLPLILKLIDLARLPGQEPLSDPTYSPGITPSRCRA